MLGFVLRVLRIVMRLHQHFLVGKMPLGVSNQVVENLAETLLALARRHGSVQFARE